MLIAVDYFGSRVLAVSACGDPLVVVACDTASLAVVLHPWRCLARGYSSPVMVSAWVGGSLVSSDAGLSSS